MRHFVFDTWTHNKKKHLFMKNAKRAGQHGCRVGVPAFAHHRHPSHLLCKSGKGFEIRGLAVSAKKKEI